MKLIPALAVLSLAWQTQILAQESSPKAPAPATVKRGIVRLDADGRARYDDMVPADLKTTIPNPK